MRIISFLASVAVLFCGALAIAGPPPIPAPAPVSTGNFATKAEIGAAATKAEVTSAISALQSAIPQPSSSMPGAETLMGSAGTANTYRRSDAVQPTVVQAANVTTNASGVWTITFAKAFASSSPIVTAKAINTGSMPIACEVATRSATAATGWCKASASTLLGANLAAIINVTINPYPTSPANMQVMIIGREPTQ